MSTKSKKSAPSKKSKASSKKSVRWWLPWSKIGWPRRVVRILWMSCAALWLSTVLIVLLYRFVTPPLTPLMVQRFFQQFNDKDRSVHFECEHVSINEISQHLIDAVVYSEDGAFMCHGGFDFKQLRLSYLENKKGRCIRGGSTISQQTAKNAFLPHTRSMLRKAVEAHFTILIETFWSKKRIMEVYLNIIEFGDGIYGCEAAAQHYFGKSAKNLTEREAAQEEPRQTWPLFRTSDRRGDETPRMG